MDGFALNPTQIIAIVIFTLTYAVIAIGRMPFLRVDRTGAALIGAAFMIGCGVLTPEEAYQAVDLDTITLLLGMMIVAANLRISGFFSLVTGWADASSGPAAGGGGGDNGCALGLSGQ